MEIIPRFVALTSRERNTTDFTDRALRSHVPGRLALALAGRPEAETRPRSGRSLIFIAAT